MRRASDPATADRTAPPAVDRCVGRSADGSTPEPREPWERFGWIMGAIWLIFLVFPIQSVVTSDHPWGLRVGGVGLILVFAAVYLHGLIRLDAQADEAAQQRFGVRHLAVLLALTVTLGLLVREEALGMLPFVVSLGVLSLPLLQGLALAIAALISCIVVPVLTGEPAAAIVFSIIVLMVSVVVFTVRLVDHRAKEHRALAEERALTAQREQVARDVHDVLGHSLTVVTVKSELAERLVDLDPERAKAEIAEIRSLSRQALAEIRATVAGLRVTRLDEETRNAAEALAAAGIAADLPTDPDEVDPRHRITLAWALRETVTNVVRHSRADSCQVTWGDTWLTVVDDGVGPRDLKEGNGIRGLRERVAAAGGGLEIVPGPDGRGTSVTVRL